MRKNCKKGAAQGVATISLMLAGCGLGGPSTVDIENSLRQQLLVLAKEEGAPSSYMESLQKNLKVTVTKNNGCKPVEDKAYECDLIVEIDVPGYKRGDGLPNLEAEKRSADVKARFLRTPNGWEVKEIPQNN